MQHRYKFFVYADINCPFCYALNERLAALGLGLQVEWRGVEHDPHVQSQQCSPQELAEISKEVAIVRQRAPEVTLTLPSFRPNSGPALAAIAQAAEVDPVKADFLKTLIYRALWVDGRDISDHDVLEDLLGLAGLKGLRLTDAVREQLDHWYQAWDQGPYSQRIPALCSQDGQVLLGLSSVSAVEAFLRGEESAGESAAVCIMRPRQRIGYTAALAGQRVWKPLALAAHYRVIPVDTDAEESQLVAQLEGLDLLLSDTEQARELSHLLKARPESYNLPLVALSEHCRPALEIELLEAGVMDVVSLPVEPMVVRARLANLLRLKRASDLLDRLARFDALTEIYNRREFERVLELEWMRGARNKRSMSLLMVDVDSFKPYNDHYGHPAGDDCLRQVAQVLDSMTKRVTDLVARYGGEEFAFILSDTDEEGACAFAERLRQNMAALSLPHAYSAVAEHVTVSIGVATALPTTCYAASLLVGAADEALYKAKKSGGDGWCFGRIRN